MGISFFSELKRRNVHRMAALYLGAGWLVMQVVDLLIDRGPLPESLGPLALTVLAIGFPVALLLAWFLEVTPEGIKVDADEEVDRPVTGFTGRRIDFVIIAVLVAAVLLLAWDKWWPRGPAEQSIAVLAFDNMSDDPDQEYFSDGIAEEILNALAHIPDLHVTSRSSAFSFKGKNLDILTIAAQLGVATVLEGSVRRRGSRVRITAQLIDAEVDRHLWSETYDRDIADVFAVQDEISVAIVEALKTLMGLRTEASPRAAVETTPEAHLALLRGRFLVAQRTPKTIQAAITAFEEAVDLDPGYALGHAELAMATLLSNLGRYGARSLEEVMPKAQRHVEQAMALDPSLAESHAAQGLLLDIDGRFGDALPHYRRAIAINPDYAAVYNLIGIASIILGDYVAHCDAVEKAYRLDPLFIPANENYLDILLMQDRLEEADDVLERLVLISPLLYGRMNPRRRYLDGQWADGLQALLDFLHLYPERPGPRFILSFWFVNIGLDAEARAVVDNPGSRLLIWQGRFDEMLAKAEARFTENQDSERTRLELGMALAVSGDFARARPILEEAWMRSDGRVSTFGAFDDSNAHALLAILRKAGDDEHARTLAEALRKDVRRQREAALANSVWNHSVDFIEGFTEFLAGNEARGLELIGRAVEDGYYVRTNDAYRRALGEHPGFAPIAAMQEARQMRERAKFLSVVCGENPYADVWKPAKETCEQFAGSGSY